MSLKTLDFSPFPTDHSASHRNPIMPAVATTYHSFPNLVLDLLKGKGLARCNNMLFCHIDHLWFFIDGTGRACPALSFWALLACFRLPFPM